MPVENTDESPQYLMGVDIGASSCKAILFDLSGNPKGSAKKEYSREYPQPGWVELDANLWWKSVASAIKESAENSRISTDQIKSIGISAETDGILAVGPKGNPLRPYIHWSDTRCVNEHKRLREGGKLEYLYETTGVPAQGGYDFPALKMQWIMKNEPDIAERSSKFLSVGTFMHYKLTGKFIADRSTASRTLLYDIKRQEWSTQLCDMFGIPISKQPEVRRSAEQTGTITVEAAHETGLTTKTAVVAGGGDTECSALGAGVVTEKHALISIGTSLMVAVPIRKPTTIPMSPDTRLWGTGSACTSHVVDNMWILEVGAPVGGAMLAWFNRELGQVERKVAEEKGLTSYDLITLEAEKSKPTPESPIFAAPVSAFLNIRNEHTRADLIRSILEGVAFEAREAIEVFEKFGQKVEELIMVGGGAKSPTWRQIMSNVTNKPVKTPSVQETGTLGAAILAGVGVGLIHDFKSKREICAENLPTKTYEETYSNLFGRYKKLYKALE